MSALATALVLGSCFTVLLCFVFMMIFLSAQRINLDREWEDDRRQDEE